MQSDASQLLDRARSGSDSALGKLLTGYRDYLLRIANDRIDSDLRPKLGASDVVQGSMLIAAREFPGFRGESESEFRVWLLKIFSNHLIDGMRRFTETEKRQADREVAIEHHEPTQLMNSPSRLASLNEDARRLLSAIESLPEEQAIVVRCRYFEELTFPEIAERIQIPVTTCRRRWLAAVESIGLVLDDNEDRNKS